MKASSLYDVLVIGGGQSGLSLGYYLRRTGLSYKILDQEKKSGGSWLHYWKSLRLFSPAQWSSLPGTLMPGGPDYYPGREEAIQYLTNYEQKYKIEVERSVKVLDVVQDKEKVFMVITNKGTFRSRSLISATGTFRNPFTPEIPGRDHFEGTILHSADYKDPGDFKGKKVAIVGGGNSAAQILAEVSRVAETLWICEKNPEFLPEEVDGRVLFNAATEIYKARQEGRSYTPPSLGDIVMVQSVKEAKDRGAMEWVKGLKAFIPNRCGT